MVQPLLVSSSAIRLATETVRSIMKIDDIVRAGEVGGGGGGGDLFVCKEGGKADSCGEERVESC